MRWDPWAYADLKRFSAGRQLMIHFLRQRQGISELRRKAIKAHRIKGKIWTQEELDYGEAVAKQITVKMPLFAAPVA